MIFGIVLSLENIQHQIYFRNIKKLLKVKMQENSLIKINKVN